MSRTAASNRNKLLFNTDNKTVLDTFAADGWTKTSSGTAGTWSVDAVNTYNGRSTLKLVTAGTNTGSSDYATKAIPTAIDMSYHHVFEMIVKASDITNISRFYLDLFSGSNYYEIQFEATGIKWGANNEWVVYRASLHNNSNTMTSFREYISQVRIRCSDYGHPVTFNFAELSVYKMPKKAYIIFTNDDGNKSGYDFAQNVLNPLGIKASFFPSMENVTLGQGGNTSYMNYADVLKLETDGHEIGIHGKNGLTKSGTTISFEASSHKILDSGNGFVTAGFLVGQFISVTASINNNGKYTVVDVAAGYIQVAETLVDEAAGATKTIMAEGFSQFTSASQLATYIDSQISYFKNTVGVSSTMDVIAYPNGEIGKDSTSFPYVVTKSKARIARGTHQGYTEPLIPSDLYNLHCGKSMYMNSSFTAAQMMTSIANLVEIGGVGIIISHLILESSATTTNFNLTDATTVMTYVASLVTMGKLEVITLGNIDKIKPIRTVSSGRASIDKCLSLDGIDGYAEIPDNTHYSLPASGELSISFDIRIPSYDFSNVEDGANPEGGYVNFLAKGSYDSTPDTIEWGFRMYNKSNATRPNRLSFYLFNFDGGEGIGGYFQDEWTLNEWVHITAKLDNQYVYLYKNGILRSQVDYTIDHGYGGPITPIQGVAPIRIGRNFVGDFDTAFRGCIKNLRIWSNRLNDANTALDAAGVRVSHALVGEWLMNEGTGTTLVDSVSGNNGTIYLGSKLTSNRTSV